MFNVLLAHDKLESLPLSLALSWSQARNNDTNEVVAIKKMNFSGKQTQEVSPVSIVQSVFISGFCSSGANV